jgi:hypothetical protein
VKMNPQPIPSEAVNFFLCRWNIFSPILSIIIFNHCIQVFYTLNQMLYFYWANTSAPVLEEILLTLWKAPGTFLPGCVLWPFSLFFCCHHDSMFYCRVKINLEPTLRSCELFFMSLKHCFTNIVNNNL